MWTVSSCVLVESFWSKRIREMKMSRVVEAIVVVMSVGVVENIIVVVGVGPRAEAFAEDDRWWYWYGIFSVPCT